MLDCVWVEGEVPHLAWRGLPPGIQVIHTSRGGGVSLHPYDAQDGTPGLNLALHVGDDPAAVVTNRGRLSGQLGVSPIWLQQVHGTEVFDADQGLDVCLPPVADACIAHRHGTACAVLTADCLPVVFIEARGRAYGVAHAGWRGLVAGVLEMTLRRLATQLARSGGHLEGKPQDYQWLALLGPAIGQDAFEIGPEVVAALRQFEADLPGALLRPGRGDRWHADLAGVAAHHLRGLGINVAGASCCSVLDQRFYSYRRDRDPTGRFATVVWRDSPPSSAPSCGADCP